MDNIKFAFLGTTSYSRELLLFLIEKDFVPLVILSIPQEFNISYSDNKVVNCNYADLKTIAVKYNIQYCEVDSYEGKKLSDYYKVLDKLNLDLLLVLGWYYMIPKTIRNLTKYGAWGIHASLLPKYAGGAPLNWAIINGERETGVTLFKIDDGVDDGDIIEQKKFEIDFTDTIKEVYSKATYESKNILYDNLSNLSKIVFKKQDKSKRKIHPQRTPEDGEIDLSKSAIELYNFVRAQSSPYPGAYINTSDGKKLVIEKARIE